MEALQSELLALKSSPPRFVSVKLKKLGQPFPLQVTAIADAPDSCSYDVSNLSIKLTLDSLPCVDCVDSASSAIGAKGLSIEVTNEDLPRQLSSAIEKKLHEIWLEMMVKARGAERESCCLFLLLSKASSSFTSLVSSIPSLLEAYQSVDQHGATSRRWAILNIQEISAQEEPEVNAEASPPEASPPPPQPSSDHHEVNDQSSEKKGHVEEQQLLGADQHDDYDASLGLFKKIDLGMFEKDLAFLTRRYGSSLSPGGRPDSYSLEIHPTDPNWRDRQSPLQIQIVTRRSPKDLPSIDLALSLGLGLCGKRGERQVSLMEHQNLQRRLNSRMQQIWSSYIAQSMAGAEPLKTPLKPMGPQKGPLRNLLSHLENFITELSLACGDYNDESEEEEEEEQYLSDQLSDDGYGNGEERGRDGDDWWGMSDEPRRYQRPEDSSVIDEEEDEEDEEEEEGEDEEDEEEEEEVEEASAMVASAATSAAPSSSLSATTWRCLLDGLRLDEVDAIEIVQVPLQIVCSRCKTCTTVDLSSTAVSSSSLQTQEKPGNVKRGCIAEQEGSCTVCAQEYVVSATRTFVHSTSNLIFLLHLSPNFAPRDMGASLLSAQCFKCSHVTTLRSVQAGIPVSKCCPNCHQNMVLSFSSVSFTPSKINMGLKPTASGDGGGKVGAGRSQNTQSNKSSLVLVVGTPLPQLGTCQHYRHSYRWLRFPCCGLRAPCDLCHELNSDHPCRWAKSMVCGFCSLEQPVSSQCVSCLKKLACAASNPLGKATRFWEGGSGCRDTKLLNKNDPHKWRGKAKTKCMKSARVGPKTWRKKEAQSKEED